MKSKIWLLISVICALATITACGGGGGDSSDNKINFSTNLLHATRLQSDGEGIFFTATYSGELSSNRIFILIIDEGGKISPNTTITFPTNRRARIGVQIADHLEEGIHQGTLKVLLCTNSGCRNGETIEGSLDYEFNIISHINTTPLSPINSVDDWVTIQGNSNHSGYVDATFDASNFSPRWVREGKISGVLDVDIGHLAVANGIVYYVEYFKPDPRVNRYNARLYAVSEHDGSEIWSYTNPDLENGSEYISSPTISDGNLYFSDQISSSRTDLVALELQSGEVVFRSPMSGQHGRFQAPVVDELNVYSAGGTHGGVYAFDKFTGEERWFSHFGGDNTALTFDDNYVFNYSQPCSGCQNDITDFYAIDKLSSDLIVNIENNVSRDLHNGHSNLPVIVNGGSGNIIMISGAQKKSGAKLVSYNVNTQSINWEIEGYFSTSPAIAGDRVYISNDGLKAYHIETGELVWRADGLYGSHSLIVTNNLLFYSESRSVKALDIESKQVIWTYPKSGNISISKNGVLYISRDGLTLSDYENGQGASYYDHFLAAVNLK